MTIEFKMWYDIFISLPHVWRRPRALHANFIYLQGFYSFLNCNRVDRPHCIASFFDNEHREKCKYGSNVGMREFINRVCWLIILLLECQIIKF